ncbi:Basic-leucine zipper (bZIP) transcription factor family protein [Rhynchospora pubera]|uniref:Basic-leucine zipper (BZIP) transcription factor family protein n=1 Tax=Rhynchospora pubera TaxID=906938 RepID=A0AAV8G0V9_9POAL|nr:Basic-leucine zipper (bZIP) transcription factor family protein [Rhynchospora pubera]
MYDKMDDDLSSQLLLPNPETSNTFEEFMKNTRTSCTHTHTCNPPGPAATSHTHTCHHTHTQVFASLDETRLDDEPNSSQKKTRRPLGNREAVRKYREKKKAHTAFLEEEVKKLRLSNQQLLKRLQGQVALEAEVVRLRALLMDFKTKIDSEIGNFPFQKQCEIGGFKCYDMEVSAWEESCGPVVVDCQTSQKDDV